MIDDATLRIRNIIAGVLGVPSAAVSEAADQRTVPGWDSLAHIHLIMSVEAEFAVSIEPDQAVRMTSVRTIRDALSECGALSR